MPRQPRMYLPGFPAHVVQRGNNRAACFFGDRDRRFYLECLADACRRYRVALHAYVLMTNHVHLLMSPETAEGISRVMQSVGRRYVQRVNALHGRVGTLWEGRHKASLVDAEPYLLACHRYIEMNPVRAGMVSDPRDYPWSSHGHNTAETRNPVLCEHPVYLALGPSRPTRALAYRRMFENTQDPRQISEIRFAAQCSGPLGDTSFRDAIQRRLQRPVGRTRPGRPPRAGAG